MKKLIAIALNTFREAVRNKILVSIVFFALIMVGISALFGSVSIGDQVKVIKDDFTIIEDYDTSFWEKRVEDSELSGSLY